MLATLHGSSLPWSSTGILDGANYSCQGGGPVGVLAPGQGKWWKARRGG
eukprot:gene30827-36636_t